MLKTRLFCIFDSISRPHNYIPLFGTNTKKKKSFEGGWQLEKVAWLSVSPFLFNVPRTGNWSLQITRKFRKKVWTDGWNRAELWGDFFNTCTASLLTLSSSPKLPKKCYIPKCDIFGWIILFLSTSMHKEESSSSDRLVVCSSIPNITKYLGT